MSENRDGASSHPARSAGIVFGLLLATYCANGGFLLVNDAKVNLLSAISLVEEGKLSIAPREMPWVFRWNVSSDLRRPPSGVTDAWLDEAMRRGDLVFLGPPYYLTESRVESEYVSIYGPVPALVAAPVFMAVRSFIGDFEQDPATWWRASKVLAAALVAASGSFVFLAAWRLGAPRDAWIVALAYGAGTSVWSSTSQALWQTAPALCFAAFGLWLLIELEHRGQWSSARTVLCGLAWGLAISCRPAMALLVAPAGILLLWKTRSAAVRFVLGGALGIAPLLLFNGFYLGSPFESGQLHVAREVLRGATGADRIWEPALWRGAAGLLFSPSRGLLVFSPVMGFALWGLAKSGQRAVPSTLRAAAIGGGLLFLMYSAFIRWWGGWCFGPRYLLDLMPILALFLVPVLPAIRQNATLRVVFAVSLAASIAIQFVGAFAYDIHGWNNRLAVVAPEAPTGRILLDPSSDEAQIRTRFGDSVELADLNIDLPENEARLWSITDSPIVYYVSNFAFSRAQKQRANDAVR